MGPVFVLLRRQVPHSRGTRLLLGTCDQWAQILNHNAVNQIVDKIRNAKGSAFSLQMQKEGKQVPMKDDQTFPLFSPSIQVPDDLAALESLETLDVTETALEALPVRLFDLPRLRRVAALALGRLRGLLVVTATFVEARVDE